MKKCVYIASMIALCGFGVRAEEQATQMSKSNPSDSTGDYAGKFGAGIILGEPTGLSGCQIFPD